MVFQDGLQYNAPVVFDNLIHKKADSADGRRVRDARPRQGAARRGARSHEPQLRVRLGERATTRASWSTSCCRTSRRRTACTLSADPNDRAIAGNSSGAIAAFAAAWQRPDAFRRVFSAIGTYVGLRGGNDFPVLIRKTEPKPIRVFLQDGRNDLNNYTGNWWIANQDMLSALAVRRLRRQARVGRRRAQRAPRHGDLSRRAALAVARLAGADQGQPRRARRSRTSSRR